MQRRKYHVTHLSFDVSGHVRNILALKPDIHAPYNAFGGVRLQE
jgi:hypothetical protein